MLKSNISNLWYRNFNGPKMYLSNDILINNVNRVSWSIFDCGFVVCDWSLRPKDISRHLVSYLVIPYLCQIVTAATFMHCLFWGLLQSSVNRCTAVLTQSDWLGPTLPCLAIKSNLFKAVVLLFMFWNSGYYVTSSKTDEAGSQHFKLSHCFISNPVCWNTVKIM